MVVFCMSHAPACQTTWFTFCTCAIAPGTRSVRTSRGIAATRLRTRPSSRESLETRTNPASSSEGIVMRTVSGLALTTRQSTTPGVATRSASGRRAPAHGTSTETSRVIPSPIQY
ncbi:MAG: hypothetical protein BWY06_03370 [Candidatus Latescibacteria bacterium ADurb.Bin168]|nr:MAG: hypothetical protein BWY06_03370 [Candidatus Latescibacteria bacterium ADurb.Bin168]